MLAMKVTESFVLIPTNVQLTLTTVLKTNFALIIKVVLAAFLAVTIV